MRFRATPTAPGGRCPPWSRPAEAARLFACGITVRCCVPVALVVGCVLSGINEGGEIATGHPGWLTWMRVGLNFVVPFLVSSYGYLVAAQITRRPSPAPDGA